MLKYVLSHSEAGSIELKGVDSPVNADSFTLNFSRSDTYGSVLRTYTVSDKFTSIGKSWLDSVIAQYGWNTEIFADVYMFDGATYQYIQIITQGRVNLSKWNSTELYTEINIEDGSFQAKIMNREDLDIDYFSPIAIDGADVVPFFEESTDVVLRGVTSDSSIKCIYPLNLFTRIVNVLTGKDSAFFGSIFSNYPIDGEHGLLMFTNGKYLRGYDESVQSFTINLKDAFLTLSAQKCLGMGFEEIEGKTNLIIDKRRYFFTPQVVCELKNINNIKYSWADEFMVTQIEAGYANYEKKENENGQSEVNQKATYSTPLTQFKKTQNIISPYRADGLTMETLRTEGVTGGNDKLDETIFVLDCIRDESNNIESRKTEGLSELPSGIYNNLPLYTNIMLTPANMIKNWGEFISTGLQFDKEKYLKIQATETFSKLSTLREGESIYTIDGTDILISDLKQPFLTGRIIEFDCSFGAYEIDLIRKKPNGLIKFYDNLKNSYNFAYIQEMQISVVDQTHNFKGYEAANVENIESEYYLLDELGEPILLEDGNFIKLEQLMAVSAKISQLDNLATIPDNALYVVAYNGKNYNQTGAQIKANVAYDIDGATVVSLEPNTTNNIIIGSYPTNKTFIINYQITRGERIRAGILTLTALTDDANAVVAESGLVLIPNTYDETCGVIEFTADVSSSQVRLKIETDNSDANNSEMTYFVKSL